MNKLLLMVLCFLMAQLTPVVYQLGFGYREAFIYPSLLSHTLLVVPIFVVFHLKNRFTKGFLLIWIGWLFVGEVKILTYYAVNPYYIAMDEGCIIYNLFLSCLSLGMLVHDQLTPVKQVPASAQQTGRPLFNDLTWLEYPLLFFPLLWFADFINHVGYIPILSGSDFTDKMYEIDYGYVYNYGFFNCVSAVLLYDRFQRADHKAARFAWLVAVVGAVLIMTIDSKRLFLLVSLLSIFAYDRVLAGRVAINLKSVIMLASAVLLYAVLQSLRLGNMSMSITGTEGFPLGVEFREYIRAVNEFRPGEIPGYDLTASTLGSLINSSVLKLAGFDKSALVAKDSAFSFMKLFDASNTLGIRTGLTSELYFAYGFYGLLVITGFGYAVSALAYSLLTVSRKSTLVLQIVSFSLLVLTVFGQSSVTAGCLCVLLYLYGLIRLVSPRLPRFALPVSPAEPSPAYYSRDLHYHSRT
ncbi:hypothetical protein [Spirosoma sordidisoli]|uniref:Oligosaccharide repeat unit polymerase n=1 Tax=Spirosoma sordidisoli TaxID=2502893 RepID=A0A4V1RWB6_9BACT|nr:hypothetical protein [Spirosoma sordidisoli]RYC69698.1 hypothetical protein EQG79_13955 [Spirosoma sordidisoli]